MIKDIKYQGHSAVPSDYECMDGELAGCYNLIPEDGALHPIMPPTIKFTLNVGEQLLWIHEMTGHTHYIIMVTTTSNNVTTQSLAWVCEENADAVGENPWTRHNIDGSTITGTPTINSIGNTLIVNDDNGVQHFLWKPDNVELVNSVETTVPKYLALGQKPPMLEITFGLHSDFAVWPNTKNTGDADAQYKGTYIEFGNIKEPIVPHLGNTEGDQSAFAKPKDLMARWGADHPLDDNAGNHEKFARENATHSIEGMEGGTDEEKSNIMAIKSLFSQSVFARLNSFVNEKGANENKFALPFFVRYGYRLYDGSYIMQSYPVLMIPNSRGPFFGIDGYRGLCLNDNQNDRVAFKIRGRVYGFLSSLVYTITSIPPNLTKWKDLITSVDIGVSAPIYTYDQAGEVLGWTNMDDADSWDEYYSISKLMKIAGVDRPTPAWGNDGILKTKDVFETMEAATFHTDSQGNYGDYFNSYDKGSGTVHDYRLPNYIATIPQRTKSEINKSATSAANFYVIKKFTLEELNTAYSQNQCNEADLDMEDGVLGGLLGRRTMSDDYHSHDTLKASLMYNFNGRMNYAGIERTPHNPLSPVIELPQASTMGVGSDWDIAVEIKNEMQTLTVKSATAKNSLEFPRWIFYPDSNAKFAYVKKGNITYKLKLTPHDLLNGAYWLSEDWLKYTIISSVDTSTAPSPTTGGFLEQNKVYTSNVYNPFVFEPTNINTVGTGKILGLCAAVKPLADDQYGKAPLYVFSTEGIWAMDTTARGTYASVWPLPRDVLNKVGDNYNAASITQLDDAVLFATDKGIMMLSGNQTQCITDAISSEFPFDIGTLPNNFLDFLDDDGYDTEALWLQPFSSFLASCRMIYDYNHQRIIVYNSSYNYAYVYSLKDHKWGMMVTNIDYGINSYPEALAVTDADTNGRRNVVNLSTEVLLDVNVKGLIITRPLKLDQPDALKTIDTIIQRGKFNFLDPQRTVKPIRSILFGSRDLYNWFLVSSSTDHYLRGFSGSPYKYFRIVALVDFVPDESVYGATIQYTPRYMNRPR